MLKQNSKVAATWHSNWSLSYFRNKEEKLWAYLKVLPNAGILYRFACDELHGMHEYIILRAMKEREREREIKYITVLCQTNS